MTKRIRSLLCILVLGVSVLTACGSPDKETSESNEAASELMSTPKDAPSETGTIAKTADLPEGKTAKKYNAAIEDYPLYMMDPYDDRSIELAFFDKEMAVPYISMEKTVDLLMGVAEYYGYDSEYELELTEERDKATLTRETGYPMVVDATEDTIHFLDFDAFILPPNSQRLMEMISANDINDDGTANLFLHTDYAYERYGREITLPLSKYDIDIIKTDEGFFIPLQTVSDFLLADSYINVLFNGEMVLVVPYGSLLDADYDLTEMGNLYYSVPSGDIPQELAEFSYKELCLMLDNLYGLRNLHGIDEFDEFFDDTGLKEDLLSTDPMTYDKAMCDLVSVHLDDLHSAYTAQCHFNTLDGVDYTVGSSTLAFEQYYEKMSDARSRYYGDYVPFYEEVGNTAYITFDTFEGPYSNADYYNNPPTEDVQDTIGIMLYSFEQITRKGSPVENVVLDLSLNTGGELNAAAFVVGMFLGTGQFSIRNIFTGALTTDYYFVDANLDHKYDERDSLLGYNLYCMESPISFSCGNYVPCVFKNSNMVTVLGKTSGGGTCSVLPMTTATGTVFQLSGHYQMSFVKNGSFYDIDKGAEPDYFISTPDHFYDRELLTKYINGLY